MNNGYTGRRLFCLHFWFFVPSFIASIFFNVYTPPRWLMRPPGWLHGYLNWHMAQDVILDGFYKDSLEGEWKERNWSRYWEINDIRRQLQVTTDMALQAELSRRHKELTGE